MISFASAGWFSDTWNFITGRVVGNDVHSLRIGLVGYWHFEETSGTVAVDYSGLGNNGTLNGGVNINQVGKVGLAYSFDGVDDYISFSNNFFPLGSASKTMCGWIKDTRTDSQDRIAFSAGSGEPGKMYTLMTGSTSRTLRFWGGYGADINPVVNLDTDWNYVCSSWNGSVNKIYVNGFLTNQSNYALSTHEGYPLKIGRASETSRNFWKGFIDEVGIWNRSLTQDEITTLYNSGGKGFYTLESSSFLCYSDWTTCNSSGIRTKTIHTLGFPGCADTLPKILSQNCTACVSVTYSNWSECNMFNNQKRTVLNLNPQGCVDTLPKILSQWCDTCSFGYSDWSACTNGQQTRKVMTKVPRPCKGGSSILSQNCMTCEYITYSNWSECIDNKQTRTIEYSSPQGCVLTGSILTKNCGPGSSLSPIPLSNCSDLYKMKNLRFSDLRGRLSYPTPGFFYLKNDIDCSDTKNWNNGSGFIPMVDTSSAIMVNLDGQGHTINNLYIYSEGVVAGLFGLLSASTIQNVSLTNCIIGGRSKVGSLIGQTTSNGEDYTIIKNVNVLNCSVFSRNDLQYNGNRIGGLIGDASYTVLIENSFFSGNVTGKTFVGGLAGEISGWAYSSANKIYNFSEIKNSYSDAVVTGTYGYLGGLVGRGVLTKVSNSYFAGKIQGSRYDAGGLFGTESNLFIENSFWDTQTSGQTTSAGGTGKTTAQMKDIKTFQSNGWDIASADNYRGELWIINNSKEYPKAGWIFVAPSCIFEYSSWSACNSSKIQTRTITNSSPSGCTGGIQVLSQYCIYIPACNDSDWSSQMSSDVCPVSGQLIKNWNKIGTCSGGVSHESTETVSCVYQAPQCIYNYSEYGACASTGFKTRTIVSQSPENCEGNPSLIDSCIYVPICTEDNWQSSMENCSVEGKQTRTWTKKGVCEGGVNHEANETISCIYQAPECVYDYSFWGECKSLGTMNRNATLTNSGNCVGTPVISESCNYVPVCVADQIKVCTEKENALASGYADKCLSDGSGWAGENTCSYSCKTGFVSVSNSCVKEEEKILVQTSFNETSVDVISSGNSFLVRDKLNQSLIKVSSGVSNLNLVKDVKNGKSFLIVKNLTLTSNENSKKTIYLKRNNQSSNGICFADRSSLQSLDDISNNCTKILCPGTIGDYKCSIEGNLFAISGLSHSGVMEAFLFCGDKICSQNEGCVSCSKDCDVCPNNIFNITNSSISINTNQSSNRNLSEEEVKKFMSPLGQQNENVQNEDFQKEKFFGKGVIDFLNLSNASTNEKIKRIFIIFCVVFGILLFLAILGILINKFVNRTKSY